MLQEGIYENLISKRLESEIQEAERNDFICKTDQMDIAESPSILSKYLANLIFQKLEEQDELEKQVEYINKILHTCGADENDNKVSSELLLTEVLGKEKNLRQQNAKSYTARPISGFRVSNLFTGGNSQISLGEEIRREIASADRISFIVSFLKVSGLRIMLDDLANFCKQEGKTLRIITTTYCGITESKALQMISDLPNTEIRISYNTNIERLHAKAYIFERNSGLSTAYIGSSNLSKSAQTDGLEWNIRVTNDENPHIIKTALATFDIYWNSPNFEDFRQGGIEKFNDELGRNKQQYDDTQHFVYQRYSLLPHQKQILDKLLVERKIYNNYRNLIVAATGTGKTVISAFDYADFCVKDKGKSCRLLYIAHREEILKQALYTYRCVLHKSDFGTLWVGNYIPKNENDYEYLFVSISMFNSRFADFFGQFNENYYDYIVIDEAHHSPAGSYRQLLHHFKPKLLIGLTATPERMDNQDLGPYFGGHISAEIRLPQALQAGLLTPFQYLCISDMTDLTDESLWDGHYIENLLAKKLCNKDRVQCVIDALHRYLAEEYECRALCFCVNKEHANYMAEQLRASGFNAQSLTSDTPPELRVQYTNDLRTSGKLNYLCVVDVFNEGVDLPEIDTVLFLRPTDSLTIFLQQLGRGLRLSAGKTELTVLDFIAQVHRKYDYASKFRALTLNPGDNIQKQIESGFTFLPSGCNIIMEKVARQHILNNIQAAIYDKRRIVRELSLYNGLLELDSFLEYIGQDINVLYRNGCWTVYKRDANKIKYSDDKVSSRLGKGMKNLLHHNTASFLHFVESFVEGSSDFLNDEYKTYATMLYYDLYGVRIDKLEGFQDMYEALAAVHDDKYRYFKEEIGEIVHHLLLNLEITTYPLENEILPGIELYGCYTREEVFTLVGRQTATRRIQGSVSGVFNLDEHNAILLFVTLNKSDKDFSPSTQYDDYVIDENHFHWQSQNTDSHSNTGGLRYIEQTQTKKKIVLFVREEKNNDLGTAPFHCFGLVDYVESYGDLPMNITWRVEDPIMAKYIKAV